MTRLDLCWSIISLSKITHQMWRNHPICQRNKPAKGALRVEVREEMGLDKIRKKGVGNIERVFIKWEGLRTLCQLWTRNLCLKSSFNLGSLYYIVRLLDYYISVRVSRFSIRQRYDRLFVLLYPVYWNLIRVVFKR